MGAPSLAFRHSIFASAPPERCEGLIGAFSVLIIEKGNEFIDFITGRGKKQQQQQHVSVSAASGDAAQVKC